MSRRRSLSLGQDDGSSWGSRSRSSDGGDLDITPMIDVTFLLLIFFMVTSTMSSDRDLDVPKARNGVNVEQSSSITLTIESPAATGGEPTITFNGQRVELNEIADLVREQNQQGKSEVVIRAGRDVPHGFVQRVIREANTIDELEFSFGVEDQKGS